MLKGSYLRVLSPRTTNGTNILVENGQVVYKEAHLPLSAKKALEKQNEKLPSSLKKVIEVVHDGIEPTGGSFGPDQPMTRKKPGPKPKTQQ